MEQLNQTQKQEIIEYCKDNEQCSFVSIANEFTKRFGIQLSNHDIYSLYMHRLLGNPI